MHTSTTPQGFRSLCSTFLQHCRIVKTFASSSCFELCIERKNELSCEAECQSTVPPLEQAHAELSIATHIMPQAGRTLHTTTFLWPALSPASRCTPSSLPVEIQIEIRVNDNHGSVPRDLTRVESARACSGVHSFGAASIAPG